MWGMLNMLSVSLSNRQIFQQHIYWSIVFLSALLLEPDAGLVLFADNFLLLLFHCSIVEDKFHFLKLFIQLMYLLQLHQNYSDFCNISMQELLTRHKSTVADFLSKNYDWVGLLLFFLDVQMLVFMYVLSSAQNTCMWVIRNVHQQLLINYITITSSEKKIRTGKQHTIITC